MQTLNKHESAIPADAKPLDLTIHRGLLLDVLARALSVKRPHAGPGECEFVGWLVRQLPEISMIDGAGNIHVDLRRSPHHRTLFTAHTDTVHFHEGPNDILATENTWYANGDVLGADDGAGVALLVWMIRHHIPGYYIFFRGEECGGIGSTWLADNMPELLKSFDRAIAFDRAGYHDVIDSQRGETCCSDQFADALAAALSTDDFSLAFSPNTGIYTDTAEFIDHIPECTNISVGYFHQHSQREYQDVVFLQKLADRLLTIQWDKLPTVRDIHKTAMFSHAQSDIVMLAFQELQKNKTSDDAWLFLKQFCDYDAPTKEFLHHCKSRVTPAIFEYYENMLEYYGDELMLEDVIYDFLDTLYRP